MTQVSADPADSSGPVKAADSGTGSSASGNGIADHAANGQAGAIRASGVSVTSPEAEQADPVGASGLSTPLELRASRHNGSPASALAAPARPAALPGPTEPTGPVERVMSAVIRKLSWSRVANPRIAMALAGAGLLLGMIVGATAPNSQTLPNIWLPLTDLVSRVLNPAHHAANYGLHDIFTAAVLYTGDILACLGLAGMLWAHSQGWRPDPRKLLLASTVVVAIMVCLTPVGSSDTASYAAYGRLASLGRDPYQANALTFLRHQDPVACHNHTTYFCVVGQLWQHQPSVYGPVATWIQSFAATIGGGSVQTTIWVLMMLNGIAFLAVGLLLLKTSDDPIRATLFWTANAVLIQQLVGGGHFDTFVAAAAIAAIQLARRVRGLWADVAIGVLIGLHLGGTKAGLALPISILWLVSMLIVAWLVYQRISADQPREVVAPFALTYAWIVVAPWVFAWYTALPWVALTQVPRNRMTRWLAIVTVVLALWHSSGGWVPPGHV